MSIHSIIVAAGKQSRWKDYEHTLKHLMVLNGEPILHRTVRQLKQYPSNEIYVVALDEQCRIAGTHFFKPVVTESNWECDKFINSKKIWNQEGRTIIFLGDVYFSDYAIKTIMDYDKREWRMFGRAFGSNITKKRYGEGFAFSYYPEHFHQIQEALERALSLYYAGIIKDGWEYYRMMIGLPDEIAGKHLVGPMFTNIDDETDDIDTAEEYEIMKKVVVNEK